MDFFRQLFPETGFIRLFWHKLWGIFGAIFLPVGDLQIIFVTGTKGKTTTAWSLGTLLHTSGIPTAVATTALFRIQDKIRTNETKMTTLGRFGLRKFLRQARKRGCRVAVIEASSQASTQSRLYGLKAEGIIWTNLQKDHLEYHGGWENYRKAKAEIFALVKKNGFAVLNWFDSECDFYASVAEKNQLRVLKIKAENIKAYSDGVDFEFANAKFSTHFRGEFNAQNLAEVIEAGRQMGLSDGQIRQILPELKPVPGRLQLVPNSLGLQIYIDFSYTPKALSEAIKAVRQAHSGRLLVITGATAGGRDRSKFPEMGKVASQADYVILTDDDLGVDDDSLEILTQVAEGFPKDFQDYEIITPREEAVAHAIKKAQTGDTLLFAGKGCETKQHFGSRQRDYSELAEIQKNLQFQAKTTNQK